MEMAISEISLKVEKIRGNMITLSAGLSKDNEILFSIGEKRLQEGDSWNLIFSDNLVFEIPVTVSTGE